MSATHTHSPGPWKWVDKGGYWGLVDANGAQVLDDGSACDEYNREIEPDSPDGRLVEDAPAMRLALDLIAAGVARIERFPSGDAEFCFDGLRYFHGATAPWTTTITAIGWDRCIKALEAARGAG